MPLRQHRSEGTAKPARTQLAEFIAKYTPPVAAEGRAALVKMRRLVPGATELVYDNWSFLVVGFGPSEGARTPCSRWPSRRGGSLCVSCKTARHCRIL